MVQVSDSKSFSPPGARTARGMHTRGVALPLPQLYDGPAQAPGATRQRGDEILHLT